jgi:hypothetical protein
MERIGAASDRTERRVASLPRRRGVEADQRSSQMSSMLARQNLIVATLVIAAVSAFQRSSAGDTENNQSDHGSHRSDIDAKGVGAVSRAIYHWMDRIIWLRGPTTNFIYTARSITLVAFGLDSVIELISASVLLWRLTVELRRGQAFSEEAEQRASRIGGGLLFALAAYVVLSAALSLAPPRIYDKSRRRGYRQHGRANSSGDTRRRSSAEALSGHRHRNAGSTG